VAIANSFRKLGGVNVTRTTRSDNLHTPTIRLVVVLRHQLCGDAFAALLQAQADFCVLCTTTSIKVAAAVGRHRRPDVVLLDASLIAQQDDQGFASLVAQLGEIPILMLDEEVNNGRLAAVLKAPCAGYYTRSAPFSELAAGIRRLANGERVFDPAVTSRIHQTPHGWQFRRDVKGSRLALLTPRELEVLKLIAVGHPVKRCAELLDLAPSTVDNHKSRLMKKLGAHKALDLTRLAVREGLVTM
jgi:DNA-binding NarL/FixJ family response regulator